MLSYVLFHTNVCKGTKLEVFSMRSRLQSWHIEAVATSQAKLWQRRMVSSGPCVCVSNSHNNAGVHAELVKPYQCG